MRYVDLFELSKRESERVEWKNQVADTDDVVKTIVAFASDFNNLGGGYVVCGAQEIKNEHGFQELKLTGLNADRLREIENKVVNDLRRKVDPPIVPIVEEENLPDESKRVLVFIIPATGHAHTFKASEDSTKYFIRVSRETIEARNGLLRELLTRKGDLLPWDKRACEESNINDIDLILFRDYLQSMGLWDQNKAIDDYFDPDFQLAPFVPSLVIKQKMSEKIIPRNFSVLLFGKNPSKYFQNAYSVFSIYPGVDRSDPVSEKKEIDGPIIEQAKKIIELLNTESYFILNKEDSRPNQLKYPARALQEAIINALAHRDYEIEQPCRFTVFSNRIEINSPGALPRTIDIEKFRSGTSFPFWRNHSLAYFFNKLQLAQAEGQGIPTIIRLMREEGCPEPQFSISEQNVICTLPAHPRYESLKLLRQIENKIILGNRESAKIELDNLIAKDPYNFRILELYCEVNNLLKTPDDVYEAIHTNNINLDTINPSTKILVAEILQSSKNEQIRAYAHNLLTAAFSSKLEESDIKKVAINLRKLNNNEKAIEFIDKAMKDNHQVMNNSSLLDLRAKSKIDLAKKCIDTAKEPNASKIIKGRAWDQCRAYLSEAEKDLLLALDQVTNSTEKEYILKDLEFLNYMQERSKKPSKGSHGNRHFSKYRRH